MAEPEWGTVDAHMSCAPHAHRAGAPVEVIFTPAPGGAADLLWPAHSFFFFFFYLSTVRCESK